MVVEPEAVPARPPLPEQASRVPSSRPLSHRVGHYPHNPESKEVWRRRKWEESGHQARSTQCWF